MLIMPSFLLNSDSTTKSYDHDNQASIDSEGPLRWAWALLEDLCVMMVPVNGRPVTSTMNGDGISFTMIITWFSKWFIYRSKPEKLTRKGHWLRPNHVRISRLASTAHTQSTRCWIHFQSLWRWRGGWLQLLRITRVFRLYLSPMDLLALLGLQLWQPSKSPFFFFLVMFISIFSAFQ